MPKHIDYEEENARRNWWLNNTGGLASDGLTVRDYFAAKTLAAFIAMGPMVYATNVAENAYLMADAMMKERAK